MKREKRQKGKILKKNRLSAETRLAAIMREIIPDP